MNVTIFSRVLLCSVFSSSVIWEDKLFGMSKLVVDLNRCCTCFFENLRLCEDSIYNIFALKCGVFLIIAFTVNRLNAVAFIYFIKILVHRLQCIRGVALYM